MAVFAVREVSILKWTIVMSLILCLMAACAPYRLGGMLRLWGIP